MLQDADSGAVLIRHGEIAIDFAAGLASQVGRANLVFAVDSRNGKVATNGWQNRTEISPARMIELLDSWCDAFLYTHIESEGLMEGFPIDIIGQLRAATARRLIVAGGITSHEEIAALDSMNVDSVVGMAIYTSRLEI